MSRHDTLLRLVFASVRDTRRKPVAFSRARENTRIPARYRRHAVRCGAVQCGAVRCDAARRRLLQTALSTWFLNAPPFYVFTIPSTSARPPARCSPHTQPLFLPIGKVNSRRVSPVIARTQIGFIHGQTLCTRIRAPAL